LLKNLLKDPPSSALWAHVNPGKRLFKDHAYVSLENPDTRAYALEDPRGFLDEHKDGAIFDEVQRAPDLLSYLQGMVDDDPEPGRFILTGSQHFLKMRDVSQSLAGRTAILSLLPLSLNEIQSTHGDLTLDALMHRGFYPRLYERDLDPYPLLRDYFQTYVERDVRSLLRVQDLQTFETFVRLCAGRVGQLLNLTSLKTWSSPICSKIAITKDVTTACVSTGTVRATRSTCSTRSDRNTCRWRSNPVKPSARTPLKG
jgi:predicted AAA+ superfamily ATPase